MKLEIYRALTRNLSRVLLGRRGCPPELAPPVGRRIWFHAASRGELESLLPIARAAREDGAETIVTAFSGSLAAGILDPGSLWTGLVQGEGYWAEGLHRMKPTHFVTFRYEAWPELWFELHRARIPLVVFGARHRKSYETARKMTRFLGGKLPEIIFAASQRDDVGLLRQEWPTSQSVWVGEPRWDRVRARALDSRPENGQEPTPNLGVGGSIWLEDIPILAPALKSNQKIWLFPHETHAESIDRILRRVRDITPEVRRWSEQVEARVTVVDRQGFLVESYARAQWAYVGGGFGRGLHSVLEPAFFRVPIACGAKGIDRFPEAVHLEQQGQLHRVSSAEDFERFLENVPMLQSTGAARWSTWIDEQFGATERATMLLLDRNLDTGAWKDDGATRSL